MNLARPCFRWIGLWILSSAAIAQTLSPALDPACGLPRLTLQNAESNVAYEIRATDDLGTPGVWETLIRVAPNGREHIWFDPETTARGKRFYRLERTANLPEPPVDNFALLDQRGVRHELFREGAAAAIVLVFTDNEHLLTAWNSVRPLQEHFGPQGVRFWLVNPRDSRAELGLASAEVGLDAPVLHDHAQLVTRAFGGSRALEAVAIDSGNLTVFYRGAVADRCEGPLGVVDQPYLATALLQFLQTGSVVIQATKVSGPTLGVNPIETPDYARDIAPLLQAKCVRCHRPGDIGSWAMTHHGIVAENAVVIRQSVLTGGMPPWHADPAYGHFTNDLSLQPDEASRLIAWIDAGAPRGTELDPLVTQPPPPVPDWPLGPPDLVLSIPTQSLPASGEIPYRYLIVSNPLSTNVWLRAATVLPGNRSVVHHSLVFSAKTVADFLEVQGGLGGFFAGFVPGSEPVEFPAGTGKLFRTGSYLVFQMHYTPNGQATTDRTKIGLYFAKSRPARELLTTAAFDVGFTIPPKARDHEVVAEALIAQDSLLYELSPHMHYRGARMRFEALYPDGTQEVLLSVPGYEFAWQTLFRLTEPKRLPGGTRVRVTGGFDNSEWNPWNPNPLQSVTFGEQTSDEMLIGYLNLATE